MERERGVGLGDEDPADENDNTKLRILGRGIIENYVKSYLRTHFPNLPEGELLRSRVRPSVGRSIAISLGGQ